MVLPDKFVSIILDFIADLSNTFPEFKHLWESFHEHTPIQQWEDLFQYCLATYPERFFDILYQNEDLFQKEVAFLPGVDFRLLFHGAGVTSKIQNSMWKYLQLILFTVVEDVKDKNEFKNSANLFAGIDEAELQKKLTEAMDGISDFFKNVEETPSADDLHSHLKGLFEGKLGSMAKELLEELTSDLKETLGIDPNDFTSASSAKDVFAKLMRNPQRFMKLMQTINSKFQEKMAKGDISQEEIMKEAGEMLQKMKEMGGGDMTEIFKNMAKNMSKEGNPDTGNPRDRKMTTKEKLRSKINKKKFTLQNGPEGKVYTNGDKQPKSIVDMTDAELTILAAQIEGPKKKKTTLR